MKFDLRRCTRLSNWFTSIYFVVNFTWGRNTFYYIRG